MREANVLVRPLANSGPTAVLKPVLNPGGGISRDSRREHAKDIIAHEILFY